MAHVEAICIAPAASVPMQSVAEAEALVGAGLAGDRYARRIGFYSPRPTTPGAREVTLIEAETLEHLRDEHGITFGPDEHRRNLTVRGLRLDGLVGQRLRIGQVLLEGVRDCPPCEHLEELTGKPVLRPLVERGGLRARVVEGGTLRVGDLIQVERPTAAAPASVGHD